MTDSEATETSSRPVDDENDENDEDASEAQAQVIASLRAQVTDLFSQVTQLNSKLVASYDRMSDLEDQLHDASSSLRNASVTISALELERSHHLAALNTGLLVEKAHVTAELNRLMERATEEAAQRGQAETARHDIEKDLDDLSASLFDQANTMVAEARLNQAKSDRKVQDAERALIFAEDAVKDMQVQMQSLQAAKEVAERDAKDARLTVRKGKWAGREALCAEETPRTRFMTTHAPYAEFVAFVVHLRGLRVSQPNSPVISNLLSQPFIARLISDDSEPTVRLDLAPSLNWLSRRSVLTAIYTGMLTVEPWSFSSLVQELHQHPQSASSPSLLCALCGTFIAHLPPTTPVSRSNNINGGSWFRYPLVRSATQNHIPSTAECEPPGQVYIFRLAPATAPTPPPSLSPVHASSGSMPVAGSSSRPPLNTVMSSRVLPTQTQNVPYPLCTSNYCLTRLRSTCSLWAFVRVGIVERIWEEEVAQPSKPYVNGGTKEAPSPLTNVNLRSQSTSTSDATLPSSAEKPPVPPPRRKRLWEMASAFGERAVSWGKESGDSSKEKEKENENDGGARKLPSPSPPSHPSAPHPYTESSTSRIDAQAPAPPLPKRNIVRSTATTDTEVSPSDTQNGTADSETKGSDVKINGYTDHLEKVDPSASNPSAPAEEITLAPPPSPPPQTTSQPAPTEPNVPTTKDHDHSPASPHNEPLPASRVPSPALRPRSRVSSPASPPPPSSRPVSPAVGLGRSGVGSPTPPGTARPTSPRPAPGHPSPAVSHIRGKSSVSSLALSRSGSPVPGSPGAPPVPRRAAARRAVPLPPPTPPPPSSASQAPGDDKEMCKDEKVSAPDAAIANPSSPKTHVFKSGETEVTAEAKTISGRGETGAEVTRELEETVPLTQVASVPDAPATTIEAAPRSAGDGDAKVGDTEEPEKAQNRASLGTAVVVPDPFSPPPALEEDNARASMDTTGTKLSSTTDSEGSEGFASDATWEERTWKELVRLKEDMFWARIGGIRALGGP